MTVFFIIKENATKNTTKQNVQTVKMPTKLFKKGEPRPANSGRRKGSPDIRREFKDLKTLLEEKGFDPREALIELAHSDDDRIRIKAIDIMMSRLEPHLKQIEHKGEIAHSHDVTFLRERMNALLEKNKKDV